MLVTDVRTPVLVWPIRWLYAVFVVVVVVVVVYRLKSWPARPVVHVAVTAELVDDDVPVTTGVPVQLVCQLFQTVPSRLLFVDK